MQNQSTEQQVNNHQAISQLKERATRNLKYKLKSVADMAEMFKTDPDKEERQLQHKCKDCYYKKSVAGQAFTKAPCIACNMTMMFTTTKTHALCLDCAEKLNMCTVCGADLLENN